MLVTATNFEKTIKLLRDSKRLLLDVETTGTHPWTGDRICGVALCRPDFERTGRFYFPIAHEPGGNLPDRAVRDLWRFLKEERVYTGWNTKFDIEMNLAHGVPLPRLDAEDVMLAAHLMNENEPYYKLKPLASDYVDAQARLEEISLRNKLSDRGLGKGDIWRLAAHEAEPYATQDLRLAELMRRFYYQPLQDWGLWNMWHEVNRYMMVTARMEARGLLLDVPLVKQYRTEAQAHADRLFLKFQRMAGFSLTVADLRTLERTGKLNKPHLNLRSAPQLQKFLEVPSTAVDYLEQLPAYRQTPNIKVLLAYRQWQRVVRNYYDAYLERMDSDHVLHPNIMLHGTVAGRPSAADPNMQAVPRYTKVYKVKDVFVARPGHVLVSADYSQAELRVGAHYAKDEDMIRAFRKGDVDYHQQTSDDLQEQYDVDIDRDSSKRINFGVWYGIGAPGLSKKLHIEEELARSFLNAWHSLHPNVKTLYNYMRNIASEQGYIRLWTGRVRRYPGTGRAQPHRALSNLIQGGVAEVMRDRLTLMDEELVQTERAHMLLQVHDQVLFEVPERGWKKTTKDIQRLMTFDRFSVPLTVDISVGRRWGKLQKIKL